MGQVPWQFKVAVAVSQTVSADQDIHNYYDEVSTRIKYRLNDCKGLRAAWDTQQQAEAAIAQAQADLSCAQDQVTEL